MTDAVVPLWSPSERDLRESGLARFQEHAGRRHGFPTTGYDALWRWSVSETAAFWAELWDWFGLPDRPAGAPALEGEHAPGGHHWFAGTRLNLAAHVLGRGSDEAVAIVGTTEAGTRKVLTHKELREQALAFAATLTRLGIQPGDRVVGYLPNIPESVVAFLGTAAIGATWSSVGQDYQPSAVADRFGQLEPRVLVAADGYHWGGRQVDRLPAVAELQDLLPTVEHTVVVSHLGTAAPPRISTPIRAAHRLVGRRHRAARRRGAPAALDVPFDPPLWVLFSSGTTGLPKGIVHGHGGVLLEHFKLLGLHIDLGPDAPLLLVHHHQLDDVEHARLGLRSERRSSLRRQSRSTRPQRLWQIAAATSASPSSALSPATCWLARRPDLEPGRDLDLSACASSASTGSPLPPAPNRGCATTSGRRSSSRRSAAAPTSSAASRRRTHHSRLAR